LLSNSKLLDDSEYADLRKEELNKALLDDLNVLYVAMTRPKHQLYIYTEESSGGEKYNALSKLMDYYFKDQEVQFPYQEGELFPKKQDDKDDEPNDGYYLDYSPTENWRSVVQLKNSAQQLWDVELDKKEWGTLLHQALSKIHYLSDKDKVLESLKQDGLMNDSLKEKLKIRIEELLQEESVQPFFSEEWEVKTEQEILQPDGDTYVPDRILFKDGLVQIVDYKTGSTAQQKKHENQIKNYAHLLQQMGYSNIQKFLIYTEEKDKVKKV
jgi:ATP-dependent exoDNAse (exonuclease V) beta subunit